MLTIPSIPICQNVSTSTLHTNGDLILAAEEDLLIHGSRLQAGGNLALSSGGDMTLTASR